MASQNPATPVKVPSAAANYTAATLDPDLRSQINALLIKEGHVTKIQDHLLHSLHSHPSNWPTTIQTHALSLLRSGEVTTFPALLRRVIEDVRQDTALAPNSSNTTTTTNPTARAVNGTGAADDRAGGVNGKKTEGTNGTATAATTTTTTTNNGTIATTTSTTTTTPGGRPSLAVPQSVVDEALKVTRECLDSVCELEDSGTT